MNDLEELPEFRGLDTNDLSAIALAEPWLLLGEDEGAALGCHGT